MTAERELLNRAVTTLMCALAHDEAAQHGASAAELAKLRSHWVDDAEQIVDQAETLGFFQEGDDDDGE